MYVCTCAQAYIKGEVQAGDNYRTEMKSSSDC